MQRHRRQPFSHKAKKKQLQEKREKSRATQSADLDEQDNQNVEVKKTAILLMQKRAERGDLQSMLEMESRVAVDKRKRDGFLPLNVNSEEDKKNLIYAHYKIHDEQQQAPILNKPEWNALMTPEEWHQLEEKTFEDWIQELTELGHTRDDGHRINKFERNLNVWRELWRVVEHSHVLIHLADMRCPLLHISYRLIEHIHTLRKKVIILLTKADLVTAERANQWVEYLTKRYGPKVSVLVHHRNEIGKSRDEILQLIGNLVSSQKLESGLLNVGFVGEPNVGKSTLLNAIFGEKLVSVSATPGHTKHLQTHYFPDISKLQNSNNGLQKLQVFDCPGIVFPRFHVPSALQILFGSYPIAQVREPFSAIRFIAEHGEADLVKTYNLHLAEEDECWSPFGIVEAYAIQRGFRNKGGKPDVHRAANLILRDTLNGKKVVCSFPPPECIDL